MKGLHIQQKAWGPLIISLLLASAARTLGYHVVPLPDGVRPEGVTAGNNNDLWVACLSGAIVHVDLAANTSSIVHSEPGVALSGAKFCKQQQILFAAGSLSGRGYVFHMKEVSGSQGSHDKTGQPKYAVVKKEVVQLAMPAASYINDAALGPERVYFTDSFHNVIYSIPRYAAIQAGESEEGETRKAANAASARVSPRQVSRHPSGPYFDTKLGQYRANGIALYAASPASDTLLVANTHTGNIYSAVIPTGNTVAGRASSNSSSSSSVPAANGPHLLDELLLHGQQAAPAAVREFELPTVPGGRVKDRLLLDGVWVLNSTMALVADNYNNRVWGLSFGEGLSGASIACLVELPILAVPTTLTFQNGLVWIANAHLDTCFPFLPCPKHKFELVGVDPSQDCKPWSSIK